MSQRPALVVAGAVVLAVAVLVVLVLVVRGLSPAPVTASPAPEASASPTPSPSPGVWRLDGVVFDAQGKPVEGVCVGLGPAICVDVNPRTDAKGYWFIDLPRVPVDYDFHFTKPGYKQFDMRVHAVTPQTFNITLER